MGRNEDDVVDRLLEIAGEDKINNKKQDLEKQLRKNVGRLMKKWLGLKKEATKMNIIIKRKKRALFLYGMKMKLLKSYNEDLYNRITKETNERYPKNE